MNKQNLLQMKAIKAAKQQDWDAAIDFNTQLLALDAKNLATHNRLGLAYLQKKQPKKAREQFEFVLNEDKSNSIAKKHLEAIKKKQKTKAVTFTQEHFIEEPGTTKIVELHRLASKETLDEISPGQSCVLKPKNRYISVETETGIYVGALAEDLSFRLTQLIERGNKYSAQIHSASGKVCQVYIKEIFRSEKNATINSFPTNKSSLTTINDVDERFMLEDNIPVTVVSTDDDDERTIDDIDAGDDN